jgi:hypothetical protein
MKHLKFSKPTSASIIAYMKYLEQVPYEDQALSDIVMITNYNFRNWINYGRAKFQTGAHTSANT